jgi:hypothetical protein
MRSLALSAFLFATSLPALASAQSAEAATSPKAQPRFSLSLERFASANAIFFSVKDGDDDFKLRSKGITVGGPIANPLSAPRIAFDYLSKSGLTLGAGLAFGLGDLDSDGGGDELDEGGYNLLMVSPRVGYRMQVADWLDLTPRAGMTLGWASIQGAEYEYCDYDFDTDEEDCGTAEGDKIKLFGAVVNLELAAAFRLTDSFNVLTGLSYDLLVAARAEEEYEDPYSDDGDSDSDSEKFKDGHLSSLQLWLGLGGYF